LTLLQQFWWKCYLGSWLLGSHELLKVCVNLFCCPLRLDDCVILLPLCVLLNKFYVLSLDFKGLHLLIPFLRKLDGDLLDFFSSLVFGF